MRKIMRNASLLGLAASLLACGALVLACGSSSPPPATTPGVMADAGAAAAPSGANVKAPGEAKIGDTTTCPISGEEFVVTAESPHAEHNGKTYYFCCPKLREEVQGRPREVHPRRVSAAGCFRGPGSALRGARRRTGFYARRPSWRRMPMRAFGG